MDNKCIYVHDGGYHLILSVACFGRHGCPQCLGRDLLLHAGFQSTGPPALRASLLGALETVGPPITQFPMRPHAWSIGLAFVWSVFHPERHLRRAGEGLLSGIGAAMAGLCRKLGRA